jgi:hypothetical protein
MGLVSLLQLRLSWASRPHLAVQAGGCSSFQAGSTHYRCSHEAHAHLITFEYLRIYALILRGTCFAETSNDTENAARARARTGRWTGWRWGLRPGAHRSRKPWHPRSKGRCPRGFCRSGSLLALPLLWAPQLTPSASKDDIPRVPFNAYPAPTRAPEQTRGQPQGLCHDVVCDCNQTTVEPSLGAQDIACKRAHAPHFSTDVQHSHHVHRTQLKSSGHLW